MLISVNFWKSMCVKRYGFLDQGYFAPLFLGDSYCLKEVSANLFSDDWTGLT